MQVIDNAAALAAIGGGTDQIVCTVSPTSFNCTGPASEFAEILFEAFDQMQDWGGDLGCWVYDVFH